MDANLVATLWGFLALFGVFISLLVPRTDDNYKRFKETMTEREEKRAEQWARFTISLPIAALAVSVAASTIWGLSKKWTLDWPGFGFFWLLVVTNIAQLAFVLAVAYLVLPIPKAYDLGHEPCSEWKGQESESAEEQTRIVFRNKSEHWLNLYWINYDGDLELRGRVAPLGEGRMTTWATHPFLVKQETKVKREGDETCIALFIAPSPVEKQLGPIIIIERFPAAIITEHMVKVAATAAGSDPPAVAGSRITRRIPRFRRRIPRFRPKQD
jgi:VHL beta domain